MPGNNYNDPNFKETKKEFLSRRKVEQSMMIAMNVLNRAVDLCCAGKIGVEDISGFADGFFKYVCGWGQKAKGE